MAPNIQFHLEELRWSDGIDCDLLARGWAFAPRKPDGIRLFARVNGRTYDPIWTARPDVWNHFERDPAAAISGFEIRIHSCRPSDTIELGAVTPSAKEHVLGHFAAADARGVHSFVAGYPDWVARENTERAGRENDLRLRLTAHIEGPKFSIITPVCDPEPTHLQAAADSVLAQIYEEWEWCIYDDGSANPAIVSLLADLRKRDPRIHVQFGPRSGNISTATNRALATARGDYLAFLDHDDVLHPHALAEFAVVIDDHPSADLLYSDEDKLNEQEYRQEPAFKPDFSSEYFLGVMYVGHLLCVRTDLLQLVGGPLEHFHGVQDYEFAIRLSERARHIRHLPSVLYHWRRHPRSVAARLDAKDRLEELQVDAVNSALLRRNRPGRARALGGLRVAIDVTASHLPTVTENALRPGHIGEHLVADAPELKDCESLAAALDAYPTAILFVLPELVQFVAPGTEHLLAAAFCNPRVAAAGPILINENRDVVSAGLFLRADHLVPCHAGTPRDSDGYRGSLVVSREATSLPAIGILVRASAIASVGGLDITLPLAVALPQALQRASGAGWSVLSVGQASAIVEPSIVSRWVKNLPAISGGPSPIVRDPFYRLD